MQWFCERIHWTGGVLTLSYIAKQKLNDFASVDLLDLLKLLVLEDNNLHSLTWTTW